MVGSTFFLVTFLICSYLIRIPVTIGLIIQGFLEHTKPGKTIVLRFQALLDHGISISKKVLGRIKNTKLPFQAFFNSKIESVLEKVPEGVKQVASLLSQLVQFTLYLTVRYEVPICLAVYSVGRLATWFFNDLNSLLSFLIPHLLATVPEPYVSLFIPTLVLVLMLLYTLASFQLLYTLTFFWVWVINRKLSKTDIKNFKKKNGPLFEYPRSVWSSFASRVIRPFTTAFAGVFGPVFTPYSRFNSRIAAWFKE